MKFSFVACFFLILLSSILNAESVQNDKEFPKRDNKFIIGLDTELFSYMKTKYRTEGEDGYEDTSSSDSYSSFLGVANLGLRLGGAFKEMFIFGSYLKFSYNYTDNFEVKNYEFRLSPFFEVSFLKSKIRPFLRGKFDVYLEKMEITGLPYSSDTNNFTWLLGGSFELGVHFFVASSFSIDSSFDIGYSLGKSEKDDVSKFKTGVIIGFTGWI